MANVKQEDGSEAPKKQKAFTIKYKRPRGLRACAVCRLRKVRCDAEMHIPCTNCITFGCECVLPEAKRRGNVKRAERPSTPTNGASTEGLSSGANPQQAADFTALNNDAILNISQVLVPPLLLSDYHQYNPHKRKRLDDEVPPIGGTYKGKTALTFLGSTLVGLVARRPGENHVELTDDVLYDPAALASTLDLVELEILKLRGAFLLPLQELAADLVELYFEHQHPLMPVINRTEFMRKFNDPDDLPLIMLLQAVLLLGCRVSSNPAIRDAKGLNDLVSLTLFRRAKALYETLYESDPVVIIQTLILIGLYWEGPEDVTKNSFYWTRVAVGLAQGFGFHRDVSNNHNLLTSEKKIWRRIWWCLFEKDRNVAIAFGRPLVIDLNDCDVPMLTLEDFNEDDDEPLPYPVDETQALYFIHLVKLAEITGIIIKHQYLVKLEQLKRKNKFSIIQHCDMLMGIWFTNLPKQLVFNLSDPLLQSFWCCLLNASYYNRLFLIHRSNLVRMAKSLGANPNNYKYPLWGILFQAARMILIVSKILLDLDQIRYAPVMFIYIAFSALMMLIYHVDSTNQVIASTALDLLRVSRNVLRELAKYWPIARVLNNLFDKYADDKIKRSRVIDHNVKAELMREENYYDEDDRQPKPYMPMRTTPGPTLSLEVSPGAGTYQYSNLYDKNFDATVAAAPDLSQPAFSETANHSNPPQAQASSSMSNAAPDNKKNPAHLPALLTQLFPEILLVTETVPNANFFENFEPTQLFPDQRGVSLPSTRAHSPAAVPDEDISHNDMMGSNIYATNNMQPTNPGDPLMTNFVDQLFINMNLDLGMDPQGLDEMGSLFNFQY